LSDRSLRVLLACSHFWPSIGGLETVVENLGARLARRGYRVTVAAWEHPDRHVPVHHGMNVISLSARPQSGARQLRELATSGRFDACVLFADPLNWIFWALEDLPATTGMRLIGQPMINADGYSRWRDDREFRRRLSRIMRRCDCVVVVTTQGHEVGYLQEEQIPFVYLPNAATAPETHDAAFRERFGIAPHQAVYLQVANLWPVKNHLGLMPVMSRLPGEWRLVMVGYPSADASYVSKVRSAARRDSRFLLIPGLPRPDVEAALATASAVLLASFGETCPVTILEAMSHGKPWLATPECGGVRDKAGGIVAPLGEFPALLQRFHTHPELTRALGQCGREHWRACFTWERVTAGWDELLTTGQVRTTFDMPASLSDETAHLRDTLAQQVAVRREAAVNATANTVAVDEGRATALRAAPARPTPVSRPAGWPARNSRCPCGSGLRYKHCHGRHA
jgi:glycosyltransferase involved in cell wall biosynthesis